MNAQTALRVLAIAEELGYEPDMTARTLRTRRTETAGVLVPDLTNPLFPPIVRGIEDCLAEHNFTALVANTDNDPERERRVLRALRARNVDGFILLTTHRRDETLPALLRDQVPVVEVNRVTSRADVSSVSADDEAGIAAAVDHLVGLGHTSIATVTGPQSLSTGRARSKAFRARMRYHGLHVQPTQVVCARTFSEAEGWRCMKLLADTVHPTAVVAANDTLAVGCIDALREQGLRCPQDVSITGFNDVLFMDRLNPPLTTVRFSHTQMGVDAARILLDKLLGRSGAIHHSVLPVSLVVRESTAAPHQ